MLNSLAFVLAFAFFAAVTSGQEPIEDLKLNHLSITLEYQDLKAFRESSFVRDTLGVLETRTTELDSNSIVITNFLYSESNYLELFETDADNDLLGFLTIVLSVDQINGLAELKEFLDKSNSTSPIRTFKKKIDGKEIPWYGSLSAIDTSIVTPQYLSAAHFWFWIMNYSIEYFEYNGYAIENNELTRENYLQKYGGERKDKVIKNFTELKLKLNADEKKYLSGFFDNIGYGKISDGEYLSNDNFRYIISERQVSDKYSVEYIGFDTNMEFEHKKVVDISDHISITLEGTEGKINISE